MASLARVRRSLWSATALNCRAVATALAFHFLHSVLDSCLSCPHSTQSCLALAADHFSHVFRISKSCLATACDFQLTAGKLLGQAHLTMMCSLHQRFRVRRNERTRYTNTLLICSSCDTAFTRAAPHVSSVMLMDALLSACLQKLFI